MGRSWEVEEEQEEQDQDQEKEQQQRRRRRRRRRRRQRQQQQQQQQEQRTSMSSMIWSKRTPCALRLPSSQAACAAGFPFRPGNMYAPTAAEPR